MDDWEERKAKEINKRMDTWIAQMKSNNTWKDIAATVGQEHYAGLVEEGLREAQEPWRGFVEHILAMEVLTPGGSNEGWAKRLLAGERG